VDNFDPEYMDELTRIIHSWSQRSYDELTEMFGGNVARQITKVITRWDTGAGEQSSGMWVFVSGKDKAHVYTPDMMLGFSGVGPAYCEMFLKDVGVPSDLVDRVSSEVKGHKSTVAFVRADKGWKAMAAVDAM
jgi:hypothetical protein